jgi:hypothetical protein
MVLQLAVAFPIALMASVREDVNMDEALKPVLLPEELQLLKQQRHAGTAVLQAMGQCLRVSATAKDIEKLRIDESISVLQVRLQQGNCAVQAWPCVGCSTVTCLAPDAGAVCLNCASNGQNVHTSMHTLLAPCMLLYGHVVIRYICFCLRAGHDGRL